MAQIRLSNFRRFESLDSLYLGTINIFVGKNNAGKSTVVKAIMLALDNIRSLRWNSLPSEMGMHSMQYAPKPTFRFDANGFHNLHIGTFERAKCNWLDDTRIIISLEYEGYEFEIIIAGLAGHGHVSMPIERLTISDTQKGRYTFDFRLNTMAFRLGRDISELDIRKLEKALWQTEDEIPFTERSVEIALDKGDAIKVAEYQQHLKKLKAQRLSLLKEMKKLEENSNVTEALFDLSYFHESIGENVLVQYLRTFIRLADSNIVQDVEAKNPLTPVQKLKKNSLEYKEELANRQFVSENRDVIEAAAQGLEKLLNAVNVDYIQAHAATQKLIINADDDDISSRVINEFYQENIQSGEMADRFVKKWLKEFEIGNAVIIESLDGEGYYVKIDTDEDEIHLADMGMGSIQLVILLLRLATIGHRSEMTFQPWWVIIEEPEQNLHPKVQSMLADLFEDFTQSFCDPYMHTLIVETHSEYLVRRTQVMAAKIADEFGDDEETFSEMNPFSVFYFPTEVDKQPYDMHFLPSGRFKEPFGEGFYDKAGSLALELYSYEKDDETPKEFNWDNL